MDHKKGPRRSMRLSILAFFFSLLFFGGETLFVFAQTVTGNASVSVTAIVPSAAPSGGAVPGSGGGGGGGGGSGTLSLKDEVVFRGLAYPGSKVTILKSGRIVAEVPANPDATFEVSLKGLREGTYNFGVRGEDKEGRRSSLQLFTVYVSSGVTTLIQGIFLPPTIAADKQVVKRGDVLTFFGHSIPKAEVTLLVNSETQLIKKTSAGAEGYWIYKLDTLELEYGNHQAKARGSTEKDITEFSDTVAFRVGDSTIQSVSEVDPAFDLNQDQKIDIIDFSVLAYWYKREAPPPDVDMNKDGRIDIIDFSILAYYWTG